MNPEPDLEGEQTGRAGVNLCTLTCVSLKTIILESGAEGIILTLAILWKLKAADPGLVDQSPTGLWSPAHYSFPRDSSRLLQGWWNWGLQLLPGSGKQVTKEEVWRDRKVTGCKPHSAGPR